MSTKKHLKTLVSDSAIYGIGGVLTRFIGVFLVPLYTRVFVPADYGVMSLVDTLNNLTALTVALGLDYSAARWYYDTQEVVDQRRTIASWFWAYQVCAAAGGLFLWFFARQSSQWLCKTPEHAPVFRMAAFLVPLQVGSLVLGKWFRYRRQPRRAVTFTISQTLVTITCVVLFVLVWRQGVLGNYTGRVLAAAVLGVAAWAFLWPWIPIRSFSNQRLGELLRFGLPLVPAGVAFWAMTGLNRFMLTFFTSTTDVGLFSIAATVASMLGLITQAFQQSYGPFAFSILQEPNARQVYAKVFEVYAWGGCLGATALTVLAPLVLRLLTRPLYYGAASCVGFLAFTVLLEGMRHVAAMGASIAKTALPTAKATFVGAAVNIGLNLALIPVLGILGAGLAGMVAYLASVIYLFSASQKRYAIPYRWRVGLTCFGLSWLLIGIGALLPSGSVAWELARGVLLLAFLPLGQKLGLLKSEHLKLLFKGGGAKAAA